AADGTVTMSNLPEGAEDPVAAAKARAAERAAERAAGVGEDNPFEGFVDDGTPLTADAMDLPSMLEMEGGEPEYDAVQEARQRFHSYENEILENAPLDPETWKDITRNHQEDIKGVFKRSKVLVDGGHNEKARVLIEEWTELQNKYKAQAYGRSPQAFTEPDQ
ncbi:MAG: hypothetical protein KDA24_27305, partial [Deltaproteobacteria bacterium]|nr:hypothetical protein [Deltaproteobacteria bacterium]